MKTSASAQPASSAPSVDVDRAWSLVFAAWIVATSSTLSALFFSEVMNLPPCVLCWYQRICMFPLVVLLALGLSPFDPRIVRYSLPLSLIGWSIAAFHVLLTLGIIPEDIKPCVQGVPCAQNPIEWFGFLSIPMLSLAAFSLIVALLFTARRRINI